MNGIWNDLLYLGRQPFLQDLRYLRIARGMRHLARVLVAVGIMCWVRDLMLDAWGNLSKLSVSYVQRDHRSYGPFPAPSGAALSLLRARRLGLCRSAFLHWRLRPAYFMFWSLDLIVEFERCAQKCQIFAIAMWCASYMRCQNAW